MCEMPKTTLDAIDRKILKFLIKNARMPFLEIARECGISGAAIHQRIRKLDEAGVILGSRLIVDPKMMGFDVCAHINITLKDPQLLKQTVEGKCSVKASGGIRTAEKFREMIDAGADRVGTSAGKEIAETLQKEMKQ